MLILLHSLPLCKWRPINTLFTVKLLGLIIWSLQRHLRSLAERCTARPHSFPEALIAFRTSLSFCLCGATAAVCFPSLLLLLVVWHLEGKLAVALVLSLIPSIISPSAREGVLSQFCRDGDPVLCLTLVCTLKLLTYFPTPGSLSWFQNMQFLFPLALWTLHSSIFLRNS